MGKADRKTVLSARLVAALLAGVLLIMGLNSLLFAARRDPDFPRLSENLAASSGLEVRRQIKGEIEAMFALPAREELIVVAGGYLWRFSADGRLLDTLDMPGAMHRNGIAFDEDGYVDWVHTGVRDRKPYAPAVDGNGLEPAQLEAALSAARIVAYGKDDTFAWAWLWDGDRAWRMDISRHRERVDTYCTPRSSTDDHVRWADTCLEGLAAPDPGMVEILPRSFAQGDPGGKRSVEVVGFDRRRYHMEGGAIANVLETVAGGVAKVIAPHLPGGPPERYWVGDAHTRMRLGDEVLQFKVVVARDAGDYEFLHAVDWWDPSSVIAGASPWLRVRMRDGMERAGEGALWALYREDLGMYAVRPRQSAHAASVAARPVPAWLPAFDGPVTARDAVSGEVELEDGRTVHRWWRARPPGPRVIAPVFPLDADGEPLTALPTVLRVSWGSPWDAEAHAVLEARLDPRQTRDAFARLPRGDGPVSLLLQVPDLFGEVDGMRLLLRRDGAEVALESAQLAYLRRPPFRPWYPREGQPTPPSRAAQLGQSADAILAGSDHALDRFELQAQTLAQDPDIVARMAPFVTAGYARLVGELNGSGRADASLRLVAHYLAQVHPHTSMHQDDPSTVYNTSVIASQALAVGIRRPQDRPLVDAVMAKLVGEKFDPDTHTNGTLLYNLACFHALQDDKPRMLRHAAAALRLGKPAEQFLRDGDFAGYRDDPEFLALMARQ